MSKLQALEELDEEGRDLKAQVGSGLNGPGMQSSRPGINFC